MTYIILCFFLEERLVYAGGGSANSDFLEEDLLVKYFLLLKAVERWPVTEQKLDFLYCNITVVVVKDPFVQLNVKLKELSAFLLHVRF